MSCLCGARADGGAFAEQGQTEGPFLCEIGNRALSGVGGAGATVVEYRIDDGLTVRSILKNNSEADKKLLVKISICNDKMEMIEEQEREMMIEAKGSSEIKKRFEEDGMIIIQVYDEQGKKEEVGGDYCITIENDKRI